MTMLWSIQPEIYLVGAGPRVCGHAPSMWNVPIAKVLEHGRFGGKADSD